MARGPKGRIQAADVRDGLRPAEQPAQSKADGGPTPVNLGDMAGLKRGLDDCAVAVSACVLVLDGEVADADRKSTLTC